MPEGTRLHEGSYGDGPVVRGLVRNGFFSPQRPVVRVRDEDLLLGAFSPAVASALTAIL